MLVIRKLEDKDVEALSEIEARSFSRPWSADSFRELLSIEYAYYLVAEKDGRVVGSAGMRIIAGEGDIDNVVVDAPNRGEGIAQALLERLIADGERMGVQEFTLEVRVSNAPAIHVYEKAGFVSEGIRPNFYEDPTEDAMILWKRNVC